MPNTIERGTNPSQPLVKASFGHVSRLSPDRTPGYISAIECSRTEDGMRLHNAWCHGSGGRQHGPPGTDPAGRGSPCRRSPGANSDPGVEADRLRVLLQRQVDGVVTSPVHRRRSAKAGRQAAREAGGKA